MNGIIIVNKEKGFTSHDAVAKLRGILRERKIGHTGTLDPDATGVLPVCLGSATKVCELIMDRTKVYTAGVRLGLVTDTQDISGEVLSECKPDVTLTQLQLAVDSFIGRIEQETPMYSARKVNGQKLVDLARKGITIEREKKSITVFAVDVFDFNPEEGTFSMRVQCSKGTYIRTLCHDIGARLGCGACMTSLIRNASGEFRLEDAHTLSEIEKIRDEGRLSDILLSTDMLFQEYGSADITEEGRKFLLNGNPIPAALVSLHGAEENRIRVYDNGVFSALYELKGETYRPVKMFLR